MDAKTANTLLAIDRETASEVNGFISFNPVETLDNVKDFVLLLNDILVSCDDSRISIKFSNLQPVMWAIRAAIDYEIAWLSKPADGTGRGAEGEPKIGEVT
ncbi:MAG: hypothetical protein ACREVK_07390 [Gammaproteobacteria bacterium]